MQFRDEIVDNFKNKKHIPFCERDWERLKQWKWDNAITDDQAQMLTSQVIIYIHSSYIHTILYFKVLLKSIN